MNTDIVKPQRMVTKS